MAIGRDRAEGALLTTACRQWQIAVFKALLWRENKTVALEHSCQRLQERFFPLLLEGCRESARRQVRKNQRLATVMEPLNLAVKRRLVLAWQDVHVGMVMGKLAMARAAGHHSLRVFRSLSLQHIAAHCNTLQHTVTHCNIRSVLVTTCFVSSCPSLCNKLEHTATHCNTLQNTATHCNTLQHTATHYNSL